MIASYEPDSSQVGPLRLEERCLLVDSMIVFEPCEKHCERCASLSKGLSQLKSPIWGSLSKVGSATPSFQERVGFAGPGEPAFGEISQDLFRGHRLWHWALPRMYSVGITQFSEVKEELRHTS